MKTKIFGIYCREHNITFVMEKVFDNEDKPVSLEVKGFYYGKPNNNDIKTFYNDYKADFWLSRRRYKMKEHTNICHIAIESDKPLTRDDIISMVAKLVETVDNGTIDVEYT